MEPVNCIQFSYLGTTRYVICDLDTCYEEIQKLVAVAFKLPEEFITAIQFTDGKGYLFNKDLFEYFLILFPQPEQKFFIRLECSKIVENRNAYKEGKKPAFEIKKGSNKRKRRDMKKTEDNAYAAPVVRQNCFLGSLPDKNDEIITASEISDQANQPRKRMPLMKSITKPIKSCIKMSHLKRALRI